MAIGFVSLLISHGSCLFIALQRAFCFLSLLDLSNLSFRSTISAVYTVSLATHAFRMKVSSIAILLACLLVFSTSMDGLREWALLCCAAALYATRHGYETRGQSLIRARVGEFEHGSE